MSFPRQDSVASRLQALNNRAMERRIDARYDDVLTLWRQASRLLKADIAAAYSASAPRGGRWDLTSLHSGGTYQKLSSRAAAVLGDFLGRSKSKVRAALKDLRSEGHRRHLWVISQVTPPSRHFIRPKNGAGLAESYVPLKEGFGERWDQWVEGYHEALMRNLRMNALNGGPVSDAIAEVEATRVSTPAYTLDAALDRLWGYYSWEAVTDGMAEAVGLAGDDVEQEIWRTSGDLRVCDDCDANEGLTLEEADGTIPLHPNCNCFPQVVPASYAALLRSGDEADRDLAEEMDREGIAPNAVVVRGEDGQIKGKAVVDFEDWEAARGQAVGGGI